MKRIIALLIVSLAICCSTSATAEERKIKVGLNQLSPCVINNDGVYSGYEVDVIKAIMDELKWKYEFIAEEGDIVFVTAIYKDITSAITIQILVDGKVYKQGSSTQDTIRYVTVSGTVPYE